MNIVLVTELFFPGVSGVVTAVRDLAEGLSRAGHRVTLACPDSVPAREWAHMRGVLLRPVRGITIPARVYQRAPAPFSASSRWARELVRDADVVHVHSPFLIGLAAGRAAHLAGVPLVVTNHALPENLIAAARLPLCSSARLLSPCVWRLIGKGVRMADILTSPTSYAADILRTRFGDIRIHVISNGVQKPKRQFQIHRLGPSREVIRAIYVGRLQLEKRVDELLHAAAACRRASLDVHLTVVGDGPDRRRLERIVRQIGLTPNVTFLGFVSDDQRDELYAASHCLWMASRAELQCCAALEAMAAGRPVVAARAGALPETVPDGVAGRLYTPGEVGQIVEIMATFVKDASLYARLCRGASTVVAQHQSREVCAAFEGLYASVQASSDLARRAVVRINATTDSGSPSQLHNRVIE